MTVLDEALRRLGGEYEADGKGPLYERLKPRLTGDADAPQYAGVAASLGMTPAAISKASQRLRQRYRDILWELVGETVERPEEVEDELRDLFAAVARP